MEIQTTMRELSEGLDKFSVLWDTRIKIVIEDDKRKEETFKAIKDFLENIKKKEIEKDTLDESAGSWEGLVDGDELKKMIYMDRSISDKEFIKL